MNANIVLFVICVEAIIFLHYNLHDYTFKRRIKELFIPQDDF